MRTINDRPSHRYLTMTKLKELEIALKQAIDTENYAYIVHYAELISKLSVELKYYI